MRHFQNVYGSDFMTLSDIDKHIYDSDFSWVSEHSLDLFDDDSDADPTYVPENDKIGIQNIFSLAETEILTPMNKTSLLFQLGLGY